MAVPAHVITVGLSHDLNRSIRAWFAQFNFMPPLPLSMTKIDTIAAADASFGRLLEIMASSPNRNFILIIHGHEDGSGLWLRLARGQARAHTTHQDLQRLIDLDAGGPAMSAADHAVMGISQAEIQRLLDLRLKVRGKHIDCIEFRACNLGRNSLSLDRFRRFLGARLAGAPDIHSFFGLGPAKVGREWLDTHERHHRGGNWETYKFPSAWKSPELVCCFQLNRLSKPEAGGHIAAESATVLNAWISKHVMAGRTHGSGDMALHGLWVADMQVGGRGGVPTRMVPAAIDVLDEEKHNPLGGWGGPVVRRLIPPLSELYAKHIVYAR